MNSKADNTAWRRSKLVALTLAVFLGPWTWLYTYRRDPGLAAAGLGWHVTTLVIVIGDQLKRHLHPPTGFDDSSAYTALGAILAFLVTWVLAVIIIILRSISTKEWNLTYPEQRDKIAAVVLAIFLGPWTWLYTYDRDKWKFWSALMIGLGVPLLPVELPDMLFYAWQLIFLGIWISAIVIAIVRKFGWYTAYVIPSASE